MYITYQALFGVSQTALIAGNGFERQHLVIGPPYSGLSLGSIITQILQENCRSQMSLTVGGLLTTKKIFYFPDKYFLNMACTCVFAV